MRNTARSLRRVPLYWRSGLAVVLALATLAGLALPRNAGTALSAEPVSVYLDPPTQSASGIATVAIKVRNVSNLRGAEIHLSFNRDILQAVDSDQNKAGVQIAPASDLFPFTPGSYHVSGTGEKFYYQFSAAAGGYFIARAEADNTGGTIDYAIVLLNPAGPVSAGPEGKTLATLTFSITGQGTASIGFTNPVTGQRAVKLVDGSGQPINVAPENITGAVITATQGATYTLTMGVNPAGSGTTSPAGTNTYPAGTSVNITATAAGGWQFVSWTGDVASPTSPSTNVTMNASKTVTANFSPVSQTTYTLSIAVSGNGTANPPPGTHTYTAGTSVNITATAAAGWVFSHWTSDATGSANPITVTMNGNKSVTAYFAPQGTTLIGAIRQDPAAWVGRTVTLRGAFRGWEAGHGSPPVTRGDWVIQDATGSLYVTGGQTGLRHPGDIGKPVSVTGTVRLKGGAPYIEILPRLTSRPVTLWHMDEGAGNAIHDATANHNDGTINGAAWTEGRFGSALRFDGVDDWVQIERTSLFHQPTDATLSFWIKPDDAVHRSVFWTRGNDADTNRFNIFSGWENQPRFGFDYRSADGSLHTLVRIQIPLSQWVHIAVTRSGNNYNFYRDGQYVTQALNVSAPLPTYTGTWYIGRRSGYMYKGLIDEVAIYDRALSAAEVYAISQGPVSP